MKTSRKKRKNKKLNIYWLILAILLFTILIVVTLRSGSLGMFYVRTTGNPESTVSSFYNALLAGDYDKACSYLNDYETLGLLDAPDSPEGELIFNALKKSYAYTLIGTPVIDKLNATQHVAFTFLDINAVENDTTPKIDTILNEKVQSLPREELFDENNNYLPELIEAVYLEALQDTLANPSNYYTTTEFDVSLEYKNNSWIIKTNSEMLNGLLGGIQ